MHIAYCIHYKVINDLIKNMIENENVERKLRKKREK